MAFLGFALFGAFGIFGSLISLFPPLGDYWTHLTYSVFQTRLPDFSSLITARFRKIISDEEFIESMKRIGFTPTWAERLYQASENLLTAYELITAMRREIISEDEANTELERLGFTKPRIETLKKVTLYFPSPGDLIRFAVREVYTPEIAEKFGLFEDLPEVFLDEAKKAGLPPEQARNY